MSKVFVVVRNFSDSNNHTSNSSVSFVSASKELAERIVSNLEKTSFSSLFEIIETDYID